MANAPQKENIVSIRSPNFEERAKIREVVREPPT